MHPASYAVDGLKPCESRFSAIFTASSRNDASSRGPQQRKLVMLTANHADLRSLELRMSVAWPDHQ